jgi:hypothetical protein
MSTATTLTTDRPDSKQMARINRASLGLVIMLVIQFVLGTAYNLWGTAPTSSKSIGMFSSPLLAIHTLLGLLLIVAAIDLLVRAIRASARTAVITSVTGLVAIIAGAGAGSSFTRDGASGSSFVMALAAGIAMIAYVMNMRAPRA